jgi:hypothetical protein
MVYDDYGRYEFDVEQPAWKEFVRFIKENAYHTPAGENPYHELEFDPTNDAHFEPDYIFDIMYHQRLKLKRCCNPDDNIIVYPFPIHKRVYDEVCLAPRQSWRGDVNVDAVVARIKNGYMEQLRQLIEIQEATYNEQLAKGELTEEQHKMKMLFIECKKMDMISRETLGCREFFYGVYSFYNAVDTLSTDDIIRGIAELTLVFDTMYTNNIMLNPIMSAGQDLDFEENAKFHTKCAEIATSVQRAWDRECGEYDDEEEE